MRAPILLVGQYALFRNAIGRILPTSRFQVVASVETIDDAATLPARGDPPSLMILMAEEEPAETYRQIAGFRAWAPSGRILIVARRSQKASVLGALHAGADGCIWDLSDSRAFLSSVDLVMSGVCILPPELLCAVLPPPVAARRRVRRRSPLSYRCPSLEGRRGFRVKRSAFSLACARATPISRSATSSTSPRRPSRFTSKESSARSKSPIALRRRSGR